MKLTLLITALGLCCTGAQAKHYKVYLLGGQSNASGRGDASELVAPYDSPQTDVALYWQKTLETSNGNLTQDVWVALQPDSGQGKNSPAGHDVEFGPELAFGRTMADAHPDDNIAIIKYGHGGSNLHTQWSATAVGDWFSFTVNPGGTRVDYKSLSFYSDQYGSSGKLDISYAVGATETFVLQNYTMPVGNVPVELKTVDFADFSSTNDVAWTFYLYGAAGSTHGNQFDDITLYGSIDADVDEPAASCFRINLQ